MMTKKRFFMALTAAVVLSIATFSASAKDYLVPEFALWYHYDYGTNSNKKGTEPVPNLQFKDDVFKYNVTIPYETDSLVLKLGWMKVDMATETLAHVDELSDSVVPAIKVVDDVTVHTYGDEDFKAGSGSFYYHREYWVPYPKDVTEFKGHVEVSFPVDFVVPGYSGKTLRYDVTINRDDIDNVTTLKYLEVARFGRDTTYTRFELKGNDFPQLSSSDGPFTVAAKAEKDSFQVRLVTSSALVDSVWYNAPSVNGGVDTVTVAGPGGTRVTVDSLRIGDVVGITVLAENGVNSETYRVILNAPPGEAAPDGKPLKKVGYVSAVWLEDKVDGRDTTFSISPNFSGLIKEPTGGHYKAAVPDPSSPDLKVKVEYNKEMNSNRNDSILTIYKVVDQNDASKFSFQVKLTGKDGKGRNPGPDSTFTINLLSSENRLADLVLRSDSASGAPLVLKPAFHPDTTSYEVTTLLPHDAVVLHLFAAANSTSVDSIVYITSDDKRMIKNDTVNNTVSAVNAMAGRTAEWQVKVYAASGDLKTYKVKFRKAFNLNVKEITVTYDGKAQTFEGGKVPKAEDLAKKFEYNVLVDTSIPLSKYEEIKVTFTPAFAINDNFPVGIVATEFLEKEAGRWTQVLRLTPDVGERREYRVNLLTPSADADLKYLYVEPGFTHLLEPAFSPSHTEYELRLPAGTTDLSFVAVAHKDASGIEGDGEKSFEAPETTYTITVTAQNGTEKKYTIHAYEEGNGLKAISIFTSAVAKDGVLTLTTPQRETVYVHTADGRVVSVFDKPAGAISVPLSIAKGTVVLRGTSGWVTKTLVR